jgi:hypothetical protein
MFTCDKGLQAMTVLVWSTRAKSQALRRLLINYYIENVSAETLGPHLNERRPSFIKSLAMKSLDGGALRRRSGQRSGGVTHPRMAGGT